MTEDNFWEIIERSGKGTHGSQAVQEKNLREILLTLDAEEVASFDKIFTSLVNKAYTWDLWGAAYIIDGGCSDDGFEYFRRGLIAAGRDKFESALRDPESMTDWAEPDETEFEGITSIILDVYKEKTGTDGLPRHDLRHPKNPSGEQWDEDSDDLEERFPRLWAKFGA